MQYKAIVSLSVSTFCIPKIRQDTDDKQTTFKV